MLQTTSSMVDGPALSYIQQLNKSEGGVSNHMLYLCYVHLLKLAFLPDSFFYSHVLHFIIESADIYRMINSTSLNESNKLSL